MKVTNPYRPSTNPSAQGLGYLQPATNNGGRILGGALANAADAVQALETRLKVRDDRTARFKALMDLTGFQQRASDFFEEQKRNADPADSTFVPRVGEGFRKLDDDFISGLPPELQPEFKLRTSEIGLRMHSEAVGFKYQQQDAYFKEGVDKTQDQAKLALKQSPDQLEVQRAHVYENIDSTDLPENDPINGGKVQLKQKAARDLEAITYADRVKRGDIEGYDPKATAPAPGSQGDVITRAANQLGIKPVELATVISYETGGRFSTSIKGGKGNNYLGLIQFGPEERLKYGVHAGQTFEEQMGAVVSYLKDRGLKPGMGMLDLYSTINAGSPGKYLASDGNGTVTTHVQQMVNSDHAKRAEALVGGKLILDNIDNDPAFSNLPFEDRLALRKDAATQANAELAQQKADAQADLSQKQNDYYNRFEFGTAGQNDLDEAVSLGIFPGYEERKKAQDIIYRKAKESEALHRATNKLADPNYIFDPQNTEDKTDQNALVGKEGIAKLSMKDENYVNGTLIPMMNRTKDIPTQVVGTLEGMVRSTDASQSMWALNTLANMHDQNPDAFDQRVTGQLAKDVDLYQSMRSFMPQEDILKAINPRGTQEERQATIQMREEAKDIVTNNHNPNFIDLEKEVRNFIPFNIPLVQSEATTSAIPWAARGLQKELQAEFISLFPKFGNAELAMAAAVKDRQKVWGTTEIGGTPVLMKWPPHLANYPKINEKYDWITEQVQNELHIPEGEKFQLLSDSQTDREAIAHKKDPSAPPPSYYVVRLAAGQPPVIADGPDKQPYRIAFQVTPENRAQEDAALQLKNKKQVYDDFVNNVWLPANMMAGPRGGKKIPQDVVEEHEALKTEMEQAKAHSESVNGPAENDLPAYDIMGNPTGFTQDKTPASEKAFKELNPTPEENFLYRHHLNNLKNGTAVHNDDGTTSTIRNITVERDGRTYVIPTVWDGKILSNHQSVLRAGKTGWKKWPSYATESEAEARYGAIHDALELDVK